MCLLLWTKAVFAQSSPEALIDGLLRASAKLVSQTTSKTSAVATRNW